MSLLSVHCNCLTHVVSIVISKRVIIVPMENAKSYVILVLALLVELLWLSSVIVKKTPKESHAHYQLNPSTLAEKSVEKFLIVSFTPVSKLVTLDHVRDVMWTSNRSASVRKIREP